jgi:hypothetical protein
MCWSITALVSDVMEIGVGGYGRIVTPRHSSILCLGSSLRRSINPQNPENLKDRRPSELLIMVTQWEQEEVGTLGADRLDAVLELLLSMIEPPYLT